MLPINPRSLNITIYQKIKDPYRLSAGNRVLQRILRKAYQLLSRRVLTSRDAIRHSLPSVICSPEDCVSNDFLIQLLAESALVAQKSQFDPVRKELSDSVYYNTFPGEHYRLLWALAHILQPRSMIEIGTFTGMGTLALHQGFPQGKLISYDITEWKGFDSHLENHHFESGRIRQILCDLSQEDVFEENLELFNQSKLIVLDGPKDGKFEYEFILQLQKLSPMEGRVLVIDDIRFLNMIDLWRSIRSPKLDATSFGHWSGTGICDLSEGLVLL